MCVYESAWQKNSSFILDGLCIIVTSDYVGVCFYSVLAYG